MTLLLLAVLAWFGFLWFIGTREDGGLYFFVAANALLVVLVAGSIVSYVWDYFAK